MNKKSSTKHVKSPKLTVKYDSVYVALTLFELLTCKGNILEMDAGEVSNKTISTFEKLLKHNLFAYGPAFEIFSLLEEEDALFPELYASFGVNFFKSIKGYIETRKKYFSLNAKGEKYFLEIIKQCEEGLAGDLSAITLAHMFFKTERAKKKFLDDMEYKIQKCMDEVTQTRINSKLLFNISDENHQDLQKILEFDGGEDDNKKKIHHLPALKNLIEKLVGKYDFYFPRLRPFGKQSNTSSESSQAIRDGLYPAINYLRIFDLNQNNLISNIKTKIDISMSAKWRQLKSIQSHVQSLKG